MSEAIGGLNVAGLELKRPKWGSEWLTCANWAQVNESTDRDLGLNVSFSLIQKKRLYFLSPLIKSKSLDFNFLKDS